MKLLAAERLPETRRPPRWGLRPPPASMGLSTQVLQLQRTAGNHAVTDLLQRSRCGDRSRAAGASTRIDFATDCCKGRIQRQPAAGAWGPTTTELVGPVPKPFEGAVSTDPYVKQPAALRSVIDASAKHDRVPPSDWWEKLDGTQRLAVVSLYNRFQSRGIWGYAARIKSVYRGEPPWCNFEVAGDTPSVAFEGDAGGLMKALLASHKFCYDAGIGGMLHAGQSSHREISTSDSLHVSVGKGKTDFDAHIDKYAPPNGKDGLACVYDPLRTMAHEGREVIPALVHKKLHVGGFEVFPEDPGAPSLRPELFERTERDKPPPPVVGITVRFGR
jgi:hypothetical protein